MLIKRATLKQLRAVRSVAETGSITGAAEALSLTAPAVHSQIKGFEDIIGLPLLVRSADSAGSDLAEAGHVVLDYANRIEALVRRMGDDLSALRQGAAGRVVLSVTSTGKYFAPRLVKALNEALPGIEIVLLIGNREKVVSDLDRGLCDIAIMGRPPRAPLVDALPLGPHPHAFVAPPDHPLAGAGVVTPADLAAQRFISREAGSGTRSLMERYLDSVIDTADTTTVMDSNETIKQAVMAGLGIAFLSLHTVTDELRSGRLVVLPVAGLPISRHWFLVRALAQPDRPAVSRLRDAIMAMEGRYLPSGCD